MSALIILVNADSRALRHTEAVLSEEGYLVAALTSFVEARHLLESVTPDLLIADVRLAAYNGLQLAIRTHYDHPDVPVIVTHIGEDAIVEAEARRFGAEFVAAPVENPEFLRAVERALERRRREQSPIRRWLRRSIPGVVEVHAADAPARIVDMSYGGVRLVFNNPWDIPQTFDISVPGAGVTVRANRIWTAPSENGERFACGAEVVEALEEGWRRFVDRSTSSAGTSTELH